MAAREVRDSREWTQQYVAQRSRTTQRQISKLETGHVRRPGAWVVRVLDLLDLDQLMAEIGEPVRQVDAFTARVTRHFLSATQTTVTVEVPRGSHLDGDFNADVHIAGHVRARTARAATNRSVVTLELVDENSVLIEERALT